MTDRSDQTPRRAAAYMRVSTSRQASHETSLDAQDGIIMRSAEGAGYAIVERYVEGGRSARTDRRPVFQRMIADACAKPQRYDAIYILNFSRFFRDDFEFETYRRKLERAGVRLISRLRTSARAPRRGSSGRS